MCTLAGWIGKIPEGPFVSGMLDALGLRGRDGIRVVKIDKRGDLHVKDYDYDERYKIHDDLTDDNDYIGVSMFARAIPSNERYTDTPSQPVQPIISEDGKIIITHNGTISNDKQILTELGISPDTYKTDSQVLLPMYNEYNMGLVNRIEGSFAISLIDLRKNVLFLARNFQPLSYIKGDSFIAWISVPNDTLKHFYNVREIPPYSTVAFANVFNIAKGDVVYRHDFEMSNKLSTDKRVLIVYSGGLDSMVTARLYQVLGYDVTLLHFNYGQKAAEVEAFLTKKFAEKCRLKYKIVDVKDLFAIYKSRILDEDIDVDQLKDAETTASYVPARNLILSSIAIGIAEQHNIPKIALGLNIDDGGAYPDNGIDFIKKLSGLTPFALDWNHWIDVAAPFVNMTKKEIIEVGDAIGAPFELSCSCYFPKIENGKVIPCGKCGPDLLREQAFKAANVEDSLVTGRESKCDIKKENVPYWDVIKHTF